MIQEQLGGRSADDEWRVATNQLRSYTEKIIRKQTKKTGRIDTALIRSTAFRLVDEIITDNPFRDLPFGPTHTLHLGDTAEYSAGDVCGAVLCLVFDQLLESRIDRAIRKLLEPCRHD